MSYGWYRPSIRTNRNNGNSRRCSITLCRTAIAAFSLACATHSPTAITFPPTAITFSCTARPDIPLSHQQEQDLLWIREDFLLHAESSGKEGSSCMDTRRWGTDMRPNRINIDTGAYATGKRTCLVLEGEDMPFIFTIVDKAALAYTIIKPAPVRQPQRQGDLLGSRRDAISETPPDPEEARTNSPCLRTQCRTDLTSARNAQDLNLERELYGPVSKFQILCFQSFHQVPALAHFSTVGIGSRAGRARSQQARERKRISSH